MRPNAPEGALPDYIWWKRNPDPTLRELVDRHASLQAAVDRYRAAGLKPMQNWLHELGVWPPLGGA